ncbi:MAG: FAD-binding oxidoreductase [Acidobacteriota bacterium]|nr:FAD-binding oxidoreductase [Acidobacteriota bacterium]
MPDLPDSPSGLATRISAAARAELEAVLPSASLLQEGPDLERYARDETEELRFPPALVALPRDAREVAAVLRWATRHRVPVTPQGARTGLSGGALAVHGGLALSLERLDRIRRWSPADMTVEVEAGVVTARLQEEAEARGLYYPPDPASRDTCQLGGNIAEDSAGPHSCKYGTTRRYVLGLEAVLAGGEVVRTGSANRKDVTGYNLTQLLVGSEGTLAVVTAATLRLLRRPAAAVVMAFSFASLERAARAVVEIFAAGVEPAACELMEGRALELVGRTLPLPEPLRGAEAFVLLELDGDSPAAVLAAASAVGHLFPAAEPLVAEDPRSRRKLWQIRSQIGEAVKAFSAYKEVDAVVPRTRLADLVGRARLAAAAAGLECVCYGHAGDGNLHVNLLRGGLDPAGWEASRDRAESELVAAVLDLGGAVSGEHGIGWTQRRHLERALTPETLDLMRRVKAAFDPLGILNPGKVFP